MKPFSRALLRPPKRKSTPDAGTQSAPAAKRKRTLDVDARRALGGPASFADTLQHPLGVQPLGNLYLTASGASSSVRDEGLGSFAVLFDDLLLLLLRYLLDPLTTCRWHHRLVSQADSSRSSDSSMRRVSVVWQAAAEHSTPLSRLTQSGRICAFFLQPPHFPNF